MRCEEFERIIFSGGEATPEMREHAKGCAACRALLDHADVLAGARELDAELEVPASFARGWRARVRGAAAERRPGFMRRLADAMFSRRSLMRGVALAACAVALVGVGAQLGSRSGAGEAYSMQLASAKYAPRLYSDSETYDAAEYEEVEGVMDGGAAAQSERKIIRTAQLSLDVSDMDAAVSAIRERAQALGGTVDSCEINGRRGEGRWASLSLSIPSESLDGFLCGAGELGEVTREASQTADMTDRYVDNESRLESARAQKKRLDELYAQAQDMSDIIAITDALYSLQEEMDSLTGANQRIDARVELSQVTLTLNEAESEAPRAFAARLRESAEAGLASLGAFMQGVVLFAVWALPWAAGLALLALLVLLARRLMRR